MIRRSSISQREWISHGSIRYAISLSSFTRSATPPYRTKNRLPAHMTVLVLITLGIMYSGVTSRNIHDLTYAHIENAGLLFYNQVG